MKKLCGKNFLHLTSWNVRLPFDSAIVVSIWYIEATLGF